MRKFGLLLFKKNFKSKFKYGVLKKNIAYYA